MKLIVVISAFILLCSSSSIPVNPGDNSQYIEGKSRYIWMPDGNGVSHLVDLQEPIDRELLMSRDGADNEYWLYTRLNPNTSQIIVYGNTSTISSSNYNAELPLNVIVHGWNNNGESNVNTLITSAFLAVQDANVIVVDWRSLASSNYITASYGVASVGEYLGTFVSWLFDNAGGDWDKTHFVGHSLGAHVVGNAGRNVSGSPIRVTGMDPAGPLWGDNEYALNTESGQYVETINTDGGVLGIFDSIGHANFYPNGGRNPQPGCWISTCSHSRSYEYFAATVLYDSLIGYACTDTNEAEHKACTGSTLNMGNADFAKTGSGIYGLTTNDTWPF